MPHDPGATTRRPRLTTPALVLLLTGVSALIAVVDLAFGLGIRLSLVLLFLPAFVSGYGTVRQTLVAGGWGVAGLIVSFHFQPSPPRTMATLIGVAIVLSALSLEAGRRRLRQEERVDRLRTTAGALQRQLLRPLPARMPAREPGVLVHGLYRPMEEERLVGGDIYDLADGPDGRTRILIADVQGKGLPAIGTGFAVLGAFRESAPREESLQRVAAALEDAVVRHNEHAVHAGEPERFVTALLLETDGGRTVRAVNCGHIAPLLIPGGSPAGAPAAERPPSARAPVEPLPEAPSVPLGLQALSPEPRSAHSFALPAGSVLLLFTDGVTEARAPGGGFYPLEERLSAWSAERLRTDELLARMESDVESYTRGRQRDDVTVLAIERAPAQAPTPGLAPAPAGPAAPSAAALQRSRAAGFGRGGAVATRPPRPIGPGPGPLSCGRPGPVRP